MGASVTVSEATAPVKLPAKHCSSSCILRLDSQILQGGISPVTPPGLASRFQSLPPMLHIIRPGSMSSCSKAPRGLFVLLRTDGIFTVNALSPSSSSRQCPYHYAIRAGLNLPDKEFRYLRTVIVTAAVHRGFSSKREPLPLTFRHRAGVTPYTSTFVFAESYVFVKQSPGPFLCGSTFTRSTPSPEVTGLFCLVP